MRDELHKTPIKKTRKAFVVIATILPIGAVGTFLQRLYLVRECLFLVVLAAILVLFGTILVVLGIVLWEAGRSILRCAQKRKPNLAAIRTPAGASRGRLVAVEKL